MFTNLRLHRALGRVAILLVSICLLPDPAWAQLEEIVVTARKREERLLDVPVSITAFDVEGMRERNIQNMYDLATFTPNFNIHRNLGRRLDPPVIRGQFTPLTGTPPNASFFIDGVYVSGSASNLTIDNLERIEVLRGPQSAIFGRATFAGAINYITRDAGDELEGEVNLKAGSNEDYKASVWGSGPLVRDVLYFTAAANYESFGGEWRNGLQEGQADPQVLSPAGGASLWALGGAGDPPLNADSSSLGGEETWAINGKLSLRPGDNFELNIKGEYIETDDDHFAGLLLPVERLNCLRAGIDDGAGPDSPGWFCGELKPDGLVSQVNIPQFGGVTSALLGSDLQVGTSEAAPFIGQETKTERYMAEFVWGLPGALEDWEMLVRGAWNHYERTFYRDLERSYALGPLATGLFEQGELQPVDDQSYQWQLTTAPDARLRGLLGLYLYKENAETWLRSYNGFIIERLVFALQDRQRKENRAVFGSLEFDLTERWTATIEARYAEDEFAIQGGNGVAGFEKIDSFTPRFTLSWAVNDDFNVYASAAKGNKPGVFEDQFFQDDTPQEETFRNLDPTTGPVPDNLKNLINPETGQPYDQILFHPDTGEALMNPCVGSPNLSPELSGPLYPASTGTRDGIIEEEEDWSYEIGAKGAWLDGRLSANGALFYIDWTNQAINVNRDIVVTACEFESNLLVANAAESRVWGIELEMLYAPTDNLTLNLSYGLADNELQDYFDVELEELTGDGDASGQAAPRVPKQTVSIGSSFREAISASLEGFWRIDLTYQTRQYNTVANLAHTGEMILMNTRFGIDSEHWTAAFYVDNILDDDTPTLLNDFPLFDDSKLQPNGQLSSQFILTPRRGRNYGLTLQYRFGNRM